MYTVYTYSIPCSVYTFSEVLNEWNSPSEKNQSQNGLFMCEKLKWNRCGRCLKLIIPPNGTVFFAASHLQNKYFWSYCCCCCSRESVSLSTCTSRCIQRKNNFNQYQYKRAQRIVSRKYEIPISPANCFDCCAPRICEMLFYCPRPHHNV